MKGRLVLTAMLSTLAMAPLAAQVRPMPGSGDPRLQTVEYRADQIVGIEAAVGYQVTIELASDEQIESAAVGDSTAWQVTSNQAGNRLFVKPLQSGMATNLTVVTNVRSYAFQLTGLADPSYLSPYIVTFRYPPVLSRQDGLLVKTADAKGRYRLTGTPALRPAGISDDGVHTFIEWPDDAALPATYFKDEGGREILANGRMQRGIYVVDGVADELIFRIDRHTARAIRLASPKEDQP